MMATRKRKVPATGHTVVFPYGRQSTAKERGTQKLTEGEQRRSVMLYASRLAKGLGNASISRWRFDAKTGLRADRDAYQALLTEVRATLAQGHRAVIVLRQFDRFGRDGEELYRVFNELTGDGAEVHDVKLGRAVTGDEVHDLIHDAVKYSTAIKQNVARIIADMRGMGWWRPCKAPYGYVAVDTTEDQQLNEGAPKKTLAIDPEAASIVAEAYRRFVAGASVLAVSRWLASLPEDVRRGRRFNCASVYTLLASRVYLAEQPDGTPGNWPALVTRAVWEAAQVRLNGAAQEAPRQASGDYLGTGTLRCGKCGARMHGSTTTVAGKPYRYYRCAAPHLGAGHDLDCAGKVRCDVVDRRILTDVEQWLVPVLTLGASALADKLRLLDQDASADAPVRELRSCEERLAKVDSAMGTVGAKLAMGIMEDVEYQATVRVLREQRSSLVAQRDALRLQVGQTAGRPVATEIMAQLAQWREWWHGENISEKRELLTALVASVKATRATDAPAGVRVKVEPTEKGKLLAGLAAQILAA
jgi:site-specific DNA recombinase